MKLIIDIPDKVKTYLDQTTTCDREDYYVQHFSLFIAEAIKNGKPYKETQGDLISREALKEQFNGVPNSKDKDIALMLIDNAPSVCERQQDEWVYLPDTKEYKCPKCENTCKCTTFPVFRYCPWCGSDNLGDDE